MTRAPLFCEIPASTRARILLALGDESLPKWQASVLRCLMYAAGREQAVSIADIQTLVRGLTDRDVKAAVKALIEDWGIGIGSARSAPCGYYLLCSQADVEQAEKPLLGEVRSLAKRLRAINPNSDISRVLCGQLGLEAPCESR